MMAANVAAPVEGLATWHFDMSASDLKQFATPPWIDPGRSGAPTLMLFSVVDDRSGVAYSGYRCVGVVAPEK
jgi:hypothetical protein